MALPTPAHPVAGSGDDSYEELSDDQIQELLAQAEQSLRSKAQLAPNAPFKLPHLQPGHIADAYFKTEGAITKVDDSKLINQKDVQLANGVKKIEDPLQVKQQKREEKKATAGKEWYNMPKTEMTPELRRDLALLKMRNVLDTKRFYKKSDAKSDIPAYSQMGTVIEGPTEFFSGRINNKDRKQTFLDEVLSKEEDTGKFKKKYGDILKSKSSGKKAHYKSTKAKRNKGKVFKP